MGLRIWNSSRDRSWVTCSCRPIPSTTRRGSSEENVELVRRGYEHFPHTGEPDTSFYSPDIEWHSAAEDPFTEPFAVWMV
jgi:hypothetical protein